MNAPLTLAPVRETATAATALLVVACSANAFNTWTDWNRYWVVTDYLDGTPGVGVADLVSADNTTMGAFWLMLLALIATGALFLTWLWRARINAERLSMVQHRLSRGWTIGAWFCPIVNLWYPRRILDDIWRTSRPDVPAHVYQVDGLERSALVRGWWYALVANWALLLFLQFEAQGDLTLELLRTAAVYSTVSTLLVITAAALLARVIRQITDWQTAPRLAG